jgi:hypothetical protein
MRAAFFFLALPLVAIACTTQANYECRGTIETRCRDVCYTRCDYYYGCYPVCYPQCYEICHERPQARGCQSNAECGVDQVCDERGACARYSPQSCVDDNGCQVGEKCLDNVCGLVCRTAADCPNNWVCERGVYVCTAQARAPQPEQDAGTD